jgi:hypothetical protein
MQAVAILGAVDFLAVLHQCLFMGTRSKEFHILALEHAIELFLHK